MKELHYQRNDIIALFGGIAILVGVIVLGRFGL